MARTHFIVHGLGYVGTVTAACLAKNGYRVTGVDVKAPKVEAVAGGDSPVEEPELDNLVSEGVETGRLDATTDTAAAVHDGDVSIVCVGTPVDEDGQVEVGGVHSVARGIGESLATDTSDYHTIVLRSTVPPGTTADVTDTIATESGRTSGSGFGVVMHPEFIREGSAIEDFHNPPFVILGSQHTRSLDTLLDVYETLDVTPSQVFPVEPEEAEILKYASNAFHAAKVTFANEIGRICREYGVDGRTVMNVFCHDRKLNVSSQYLRPGFAFGGSCLHKDTKALAQFASGDQPLIETVIPANDRHIQAAFERIVAADPKTVGIAGLTFKPGTDDVRNSPAVLLARWLIDEGVDVVTYDPNVHHQDLIGTNEAFIEATLPELDTIQVNSLGALVEQASYVFVGNADDRYTALAEAEVQVFDPTGVLKDCDLSPDRYHSLCW